MTPRRRYLRGDLVSRITWDREDSPRLSGPNRWIVREDEIPEGFISMNFESCRIIGAWVHFSDVVLLATVEDRVARELMA